MSEENLPTEGAFKVSIAHYFILGCALFSIFWGVINAILVKNVDLTNHKHVQQVVQEEKDRRAQATPHTKKEIEDEGEEVWEADQIMKQLDFISTLITEGADSFLQQEYLYLGIFAAAFAVLLGLTVDYSEINGRGTEGKTEGYQQYFNPGTNFAYTSVAFLAGCFTSIVAGWIGMKIAVYTNSRTTFGCCESVNTGFLAAFRGGQVLGFVLVGLALLVLEIIIITFKAGWYDAQQAALGEVAWPEGDEGAALKIEATKSLVRRLFELVAGFGLGGSTVALFGRVGGGIYTKAADVGSDLVGKNLKDLPEDSPENPGTIADNVGDNVGDIAGMGADLFGSLAESTCAALVVSATSYELIMTTDALFFPLMITSAGIVASFISVLFVHTVQVTTENVQSVLKTQILLSSVLMTGTIIPCIYVLPADGFTIGEGSNLTEGVTRWDCFGCIAFGLWSGCIIGYTTEYYTSNAYSHVLNLVDSCKMGAAPNIIQGLALGYVSCIVPVLCLAATIGYSFNAAGLYGIGIAALGMLGSLPVALTIDGYGPISDNAGGIAEMCGLPSSIRDKTDALDAAGNTTAAIGKGFAIGSACLVGLALFGAFITRIEQQTVDILRPVQFCGLLVGAMLPYAFSAMTMKAVGDAAFLMMEFIIKDFEEGKAAEAAGKGKYQPSYDGCIKISTDASLRMMIAPGILVLGSPLLAGFLFGPDAVAGLLAGIIVSGVQVAISASNTGGAWDNTKKEIEKRRSAFKKLASAGTYEGENTVEEEAQRYKDLHVAAVIGDTVGDPLKDTSGPAINILIKLSAITSLVFGTYIKENHYFNNKAE